MKFSSSLLVNEIPLKWRIFAEGAASCYWVQEKKLRKNWKYFLHCAVPVVVKLATFYWRMPILSVVVIFSFLFLRHTTTSTNTRTRKLKSSSGEWYSKENENEPRERRRGRNSGGCRLKNVLTKWLKLVFRWRGEIGGGEDTHSHREQVGRMFDVIEAKIEKIGKLIDGKFLFKTFLCGRFNSIMFG